MERNEVGKGVSRSFAVVRKPNLLEARGIVDHHKINPSSVIVCRFEDSKSNSITVNPCLHAKNDMEEELKGLVVSMQKADYIWIIDLSR